MDVIVEYLVWYFGGDFGGVDVWVVGDYVGDVEYVVVVWYVFDGELVYGYVVGIGVYDGVFGDYIGL